MSFLKRLFGGGSSGAGDEPPAGADVVEHKGFTITPAPQKDGGKWRIAAFVEKDGQTHHLIRADMLETAEEAGEAAVAKAKLMIDQLNGRIFD